MAYISTGKELIDPFKMLESVGIRADMSVADFGCGTLGHYVFPAAQLVGPRGSVYAIDILKSVLASIESRAKSEGHNNIHTVWGDMERKNGIKLDDNSLDLGLLVNNISLSNMKEEMMKECVRVIKKGGLFLIADWKPTGAKGFGPSLETRVGIDEAKRLGAGAGLVLEKEFEPGQFHYGLLFKKS